MWTTIINLFLEHDEDLGVRSIFSIGWLGIALPPGDSPDSPVRQKLKPYLAIQGKSSTPPTTQYSSPRVALDYGHQIYFFYLIYIYIYIYIYS